MSREFLWRDKVRVNGKLNQLLPANAIKDQ